MGAPVNGQIIPVSEPRRQPGWRRSGPVLRLDGNHDADLGDY